MIQFIRFSCRDQDDFAVRQSPTITDNVRFTISSAAGEGWTIMIACTGVSNIVKMLTSSSIFNPDKVIYLSDKQALTI